jgi:hypothetical protein
MLTISTLPALKFQWASPHGRALVCELQLLICHHGKTCKTARQGQFIGCLQPNCGKSFHSILKTQPPSLVFLVSEKPFLPPSCTDRPRNHPWHPASSAPAGQCMAKSCHPKVSSQSLWSIHAPLHAITQSITNLPTLPNLVQDYKPYLSLQLYTQQGKLMQFHISSN